MKTAFIVIAVAAVIVAVLSGWYMLFGTGGEGRLTDGMVIESGLCAAKGIEESVLVFHSPECPACRQTVPVLEEIESETGKGFEFIDIASAQGKERMAQLRMMPDYIPTVVIKCRVYVGYRDKAAFMSLLGG